MKPLPKSTRLVWTLNGYLLLIVLIAAICLAGAAILSSPLLKDRSFERGAIVGNAADAARQLDVVPQHLEYNRPERIADSNYYMTSVYVLDKELPTEVRNAINSAGDVSMNLIGARVNVLFFSEDRAEVNKLVDGFGYIGDIHIPGSVHHYRDSGTQPEIALPEHILFEVATGDTNGDQRINEDDRKAFYLSDYSGRNLRQITPDTLNLTDHWYTSDYTGIFFEDIIVGDVEEVYGVEYTLDEHRLYYYDLETEQFESFDGLQKVFYDILDEYKSLPARDES